MVVTEPLDRVYAIAGLMDSDLQRCLPYDYSEEAKQTFWLLYVEFAKLVVSKDPGFHIIYNAPSIEKPAEIPTWCPNLASPLCGISVPDEMFKAGFLSYETPISSITVSDSSNLVRVPGFRIDTIREVI